MMRVLFWLSIGFDRRGPSEHLLIAIIEALCKQGHSVHVLQKNTGGTRDGLPSELKQLGVTTTTVEYRMPPKSNLIARYIADGLYIDQCRKWLKKNGVFDRVFLQSSNVAGFQVHVLRKLLKGVPIIFNVQDIFPENAAYSGTLSKGGLPYRVLSAIQRYAYRHVNRIITISEDMKDQLVELGTPDDKVEVVYNWSYQDDVYHPDQTVDDSVNELMGSSNTFNVVYAGNIGMMQNVEVVMKAAELLQEQPEIGFYIIGNGLYREKLKAYANEKQLKNVWFHDMLPASSAPALYCKADINVIPLAKHIYRTALPSKTATCIACQKPIIFAMGRDCLTVQKISAETGAYVVDSEDALGLANAIMEIKKGRKHFESASVFRKYFQMTTNSGEYANVITDAVQLPKRRR